MPPLVGVSNSSAAGTNGTAQITAAQMTGLGIQAGDILVVACATSGNPTQTPPTGYVLLAQQNLSTTWKQFTYYKVADGTENGVAQQFVLGTSQRWVLGLVVVRGIDTGTPLDVAIGTAATAVAPSVTALNPGVTIRVHSPRGTSGGGTTGFAGTLAPDAVSTEDIDAGNASSPYVGLEMAHEDRAASGATGAATATTTQAGVTGWFSQTIALRASSTGQARTVQINDTLAVADQVTSVVTYTRQVDDTLAVADLLVPAAAYTARVDDAASVADALTPSAGFVASVADALAVADQLTVSNFAARTLAIDDTLAVADAFSLAADYSRLLSDVLAVQDALATSSEFARSMDDALGVLDGLDLAADYRRALDDTLGVTDQLTPQLGAILVLADTLNVADQLDASHGLELVLADTLAVSDALDLVWQQIVAGPDAVCIRTRDGALTLLVMHDTGLIVVKLSDHTPRNVHIDARGTA